MAMSAKIDLIIQTGSKQNIILTLLRAILAGVCIAIGAILYLTLGGVVGAVLFSIGLFSILLLKLKLYTGAIGYIKTYKEIPTMGLIILGNLIGCCLMFAFPFEGASAIIANKLSAPLFLTFIRAMLCGVLIYVAVEGYKANNSLITLISIPSFILLGAEHSIADFCFFIAARYISWDSILFLLTVIIGNALGSIIFHRIAKGELNELLRFK